MKALILGAGVIGLTTAYALTEAGVDVTIVDRNPAPGGDASPGNGAQLSYNFVAPFASPDTLRHLPALLLERNGPTRLRPGLDPAFLRWGLSFLRHCTTTAVRQTTTAQLALAASSQAEMTRLTTALPIEFGLRTAGKLVLYRGQSGFRAAQRQHARQRGLGAGQLLLTPRECLDLEPALRIPETALSGGVYTPSDQVGDCAAFCQGLAAHLQTRNTVTWHLGTPCTPWLEHGQLLGVHIGPQSIRADQTILCLGAGAPAFAKAAGLHLPIIPMKGYSLTLHSPNPVTHSVTDMDRKIVFAPLSTPTGAMIRVAGIADFVGMERRIDPARLATITKAALETVDIEPNAGTAPWTGLRPVTPDSRPLIGPSPIPGLFLNTGHGGLGWTLAAGSARLTTDLILANQPQVTPAWFNLNR